VCLGAADRYLGIVTSHEQRWDDASRHFEVAIALESQLESAPLVARTRLWYARALVARGRQGDRDRARGLLDAVAVTADELGMDGLRRGLDATRDRLR
jgi:hypothetical protein